ncbi:hypothetical protein CHUAL_004541 [Chamberlinius hualienensis]
MPSECHYDSNLMRLATKNHFQSVNPRDGSSPFKRQSLSPTSRGYPTGHYLHPDVRYAPNIHPPPPPPPVSYGSSQMYRDSGLYQAAERLTVVESREPAGDHPHSSHHQQYREQNEHSQPQPPAGYQQQSTQAAVAAAVAAAASRRRPSLLPQTDYSNAINRDRYLDNYPSSYYDHELSTAVSAAGGMPTHAYPIIVGHHGPPMDPSDHHLIVKRPRLTIMGNEQKQDAHRMLGIDTDIKREPAYNPQVEAISPTLPSDDYHQDSSPHRTSRDDLLQQIGKVDREIVKIENQIAKLKKKQQELEMAAAKPDNDKHEPLDTGAQEITKHLSMAQEVYAENKVKSQRANQMLSKLGHKVDLPLYNQPFDTPCYHENIKKFPTFKKKLLPYFKKRLQDRQSREKYLTDTYNNLLQQWQKRVERIENNVKKKAKEQKIREFYEKQFPELKKQREDKERFSRVGTRIRSDAELEEIMDGLQEQELEDKKMRSYAVVPPIIVDPRHRRLAYENDHSIIEDLLAEYNEKKHINIWTQPEQDVFKEKYLQHPKNFALVASYLERKSVADCVQYYYLTKKDANYKQLLRKHSVRKKRFNKPNQSASHPAPSPQTGVLTRQGASAAHPDDGSKSAAPATNNTSSSTTTSTSSSNTSSSTTTASSCSNNTNVTNSLGNNEQNSSGTSTSAGSGENSCAENSKSEQKEQNHDGCENSSKCDNKDPETEKETNKDDDTCDDHSDSVEATTEAQERSLGGPHTCVVCKTVVEHYGLSRPVSKSSCHQYGLKEEEVTADIRVCSLCHCRSVRSRYTHCPILSCRSPKRKVKRLRPLPSKWNELPPEVKDPIVQDLQIPPDVTKCCSACFNRIARRIGSNGSDLAVSSVSDGLENSRWTEDEIELFKRGLKENGLNWYKVATVVSSKSEIQCKNFYFNYRRKLNLGAFVSDKFRGEQDSETGDKVPPTVTDEEESGESTSSCEDFNGPYQDGSDTASASSPSGKVFDEESKKGFKDPASNPKKQIDEISVISANFIDDPVSLQESKDLSASRGSLKSVTDYDSSATVSADEGPSQLDGDSGVSIQIKGDPRHSSNGSREDSNSQSSAPSFLDESRVKVLLSQAAATRTDNQPSNIMYRSDVESSTKGGSVTERVELEGGEHIFTKTVRDLIDQAIDTSFPDGTSSNGPLTAVKSGTSGIPNIHDILKRSEKPAGMKSRTKEFTRDQIEILNPAVQPQPAPLTINAQLHHSDAVGVRLSSSHIQQHLQQRPVHSSMQPHSSFIQQPAPPNLISQHHLPSPSSSSHPPLQPPSSRIHHGYPHSSSNSSSGQPVLMPRESLPTVNLYVPDDVEQVKAEDLSIKKDRSRDLQPEYNRSSSSSSSSSTFRSLPVQKSPIELTRHSVPPSPNQPPPPSSSSQHMVHHGDRLLGAPPPAHSNQYHRSSEMSHMSDPRDAYYGIRSIEPRTKSPSTFTPDRVSQSQHIPPSQQQCPRPMSPHVQGYISLGCSPPLKGQTLKGSNGTLVSAPPPLVSGSKHNTPSPKMTLKQDKLMSSSGSITQGTPVNQSNMSGSHAVMPSHSGGRYEDYIHHKDVGGSITLGTPVQHESPASKRCSESSAPLAPNVVNDQGPRGVLMVADGVKGPSQGYDPYYHRRVSPPAVYPYSNFPPYPRPQFATESQISSRQTIMTDYYLSQQMQMRRNSGNEKDKEARMSPRMPRDCSPQSGSVLVDHRMHVYPYPAQPGLPPVAYMQHPDARLSQQQQQQRHLASPIGNVHDVHESSRSASPGGGPPPPLWPRGSNHSPTMATPPPVQQPQQQQRGVIRSTVSCNPSLLPKVKSGVGVIQSPKSSSPRSSDMEAYGPPKSTPSPRHPYTHGNEAFGNLIDAAIAQAIPKDVSKHHSNLPAHVSPGLPQGSIHDLRNMMPGMREEKLNSTHKNMVYYDERRGPQPSLPPSTSQSLKERHKYENSPKMDTINMEERVRKFGPMLNSDDGPSSSHPGMQSPFTRPEYGRMDADKMRMVHYKNPMPLSGPPPAHPMPPMPSRDGPPIEVDDDRPPSHHHHRVSPHHQLSAHRGSAPPVGFSGEQRRPSPPQDLSSESRRSTMEAYNAYANRGTSSYKQYEGDPTKLLFDALEKDQPKEPGPSGEKPQTFTAANLIDAIISHQINKVTTSPTLKRRAANSSEGAPPNKNFRISPDASNMNSDGRISPSPYKLQRAPSYPGSVPKQKEELVVTLDDSPMNLDREQDIPSHLASSSHSSSHSLSNTNAGMRGTSPISSYVNSERPISRGRTPQPSSSPAAVMAAHSPSSLKLTLKEHIDAIISHDYQYESAHGHYNRSGDGRPPSGSGVSSQSIPAPTPPPSSSQSGRAFLGVHDVPERSSPNVQPSTRSASPEDQMHTTYPNWKLRKALQQSKEHQRELQEQRQSPSDNARSRATPTSVSPLPPRSKGLLAPDERQIIRIVQSASPRPSDMSSKGSAASVSPLMSHPPTSQQQQTSSSLANYQVEPISPPSAFGSDSNLGEASSTTNLAPSQSSTSWLTSPNITSLLTARRMYPPSESADTTTPQSGIARPHQQPTLSPFEKYVKHKIVEEMRKSSEESSGELSLEGRSGQQPRSSSPRVDDRNNVWPIDKEHPSSGVKCRSNELNDPVTAGMFPGPASRTASSSMGPSPSSSRSGDIPRPPFKRTFEVVEAVGSSERSASAAASSSGNIRSRSISPSSSDISAREVEDIKRKRYRLGDSTVGGSSSGTGGHTTPESSTEWAHQMLVPESSESSVMSHRSGNAVPSNSHVAREPQLSSSSDHQTQVASGSLPSSSGCATGSGHRSGFSSSSSSSPDRPQPSRKDIEDEGEAQSTGTGLSGSSSRMGVSHHASSQSSNSFDGKPVSSMWGNEVSSGKDDKVVSQMADSPLSGEMVIDESAGIDSATSSKLEPVSPPPQEGISTSEQEQSYALVTGRLLSSNNSSHLSDPGHSVTSSHGTETRSSPVGGPGSSGGGSTSVSASSTGGVAVGSSYSNPISSTVSNSSSFSNSSALVNNISGVSTTYTYPFSALSVRSLPAAVGNSANPTSPSTVVSTPSSSSSQQSQQQQPNQSLTSSTSRSNSPVSATREVPSLLMSSQYEPLSDED